MGNSSLFAISVLFSHHHSLFEAAFGGWLGGEVPHFLCFHRHFLALRLQQFRTDLRLLFLPRVLVIGAEWRPNAEKVFGLRVCQLGGKRFFFKSALYALNQLENKARTLQSFGLNE